MAKLKRLGMSPRQQELNRLWAFYRCMNYETCRLDWDGKERVGAVEREAIATAGFLPPGFYDAGGQMNAFPLKFRKPTSPYHLAKVIVDRFTGLLFSERLHPRVKVEDDEATEDYVSALIKATGLWAHMILARTYGGATGTAVLGFQFVDGQPIVEVHDPRWIIPDFEDRHALKLKKIEIKYQFPKEVYDPDSREWDEIPYWYRRTIDEKSDILYHEVPVTDEEPVWQENKRVDHNFGFCPIVWIQNMPVLDSIDGDPDAHGIFDNIEAIDALIAQAHRGTISNCDPTLLVKTDAPLSDVKTGSSTTLKLPAGGDAKFLELQGTATKAAIELADRERAWALEVAQCVLEHPDVANRTATEVERSYGSMISKADVMREQYGERGIKKILMMMLLVARRLGTATKVGDKMVRSQVSLPQKMGKDEEGKRTSTPRDFGKGISMEMQWPKYFEPTGEEISKATDAAGKAKELGLIDEKHAVEHVADMFNVDDVESMMEVIAEEKEAKKAELQEQMMNSMPPGSGEEEEDDEDEGRPPVPFKKKFAGK